jgi:hypothetical protein
VFFAEIARMRAKEGDARAPIFTSSGVAVATNGVGEICTSEKRLNLLH